MSKIIRSTRLALLAILLLAFILRLYKITNPILDWHAFRQADTASVTREYLKNGIDLLRPRYHDLGNVQSGLDNPKGWRMVEFPIINGSIAILLQIIPFLPLVLTSRIVSILVSVGTLICLYLIVNKLTSKKAALWTGFSFAVLPYAIYYSRVILPEPFMLFFSCLSIWSFIKFLDKEKIINLLISSLALATALLLKPYVLFTGLVYIVLAWYKYGWKLIKKWQLYLMLILALLPLILWRSWIQNFPAGVPDSDWLFNSDGIRLRPAWFRWIFYERLTKLFLGFTGIILLFANFLKKKEQKLSQDFWIYFAWWIGMLAYLIIFATGNVKHDYYQNLLLPIICISVGRGVVILQKYLTKLSGNKIANFSIGFIYISMLLLAWRQVKGFFNVNHWEYFHAGQEIESLLPVDAKVIAPTHNGDTMFLFQTGRIGWPLGVEIEDKIAKGATHYVSTSYDNVVEYLQANFATLEKNQQYTLIDLTKPHSSEREI